MTTWWNEGRVALLNREAREWVGTPFAPNSASKGRGVSCQHLAGAIYQACGYPVPLDIPDVPIAHARFSTSSFVTSYFDARHDFAPVAVSGPLLQGDVLGFRIGRCVHHIGTLLEGGQFIHVLEGTGAMLATLADATWFSRLENVWRPRA